MEYFLFAPRSPKNCWMFWKIIYCLRPKLSTWSQKNGKSLNQGFEDTGFLKTVVFKMLVYYRLKKSEYETDWYKCQCIVEFLGLHIYAAYIFIALFTDNFDHVHDDCAHFV